MKLWSGRFTKATNALLDEFNASIGFDYQLAEYDIAGSIAHVMMLAKCDLITDQEAALIKAGLETILHKIKNQAVTYRLQDEDIHMNIERLLHEEIGEVAGKLHTGRSRNDQVALDIHLYLREHIVLLIKQLQQLLLTLHHIASEHIDSIMPGYTHLQRAEPIRFAHHMLAYFAMFSRDIERLMDNYQRVDICPLGAGALAGSGVSINREYSAELLNFSRVYSNSLDAVSDRDFIVEFLANASLIMLHFSKLSEEIILWCSQEFSFITLDDAFATGSSMMPQKKNPDIAELVRGKSGRTFGALMSLLVTLKGLPLAYNKDMQEDKEGLFDTIKTLMSTITIYDAMLATMQINAAAMLHAAENDFSNATALANYLTLKNIPFRMAHEITGKIVQYCYEKKILLNQLDIQQYQLFCPQIEKDIYDYLTPEAVIESHTVSGGTGRQSVMEQLNKGLTILGSIETWIEQHQACFVTSLAAR